MDLLSYFYYYYYFFFPVIERKVKEFYFCELPGIERKGSHGL